MIKRTSPSQMNLHTSRVTQRNDDNNNNTSTFTYCHHLCYSRQLVTGAAGQVRTGTLMGEGAASQLTTWQDVYHHHHHTDRNRHFASTLYTPYTLPSANHSLLHSLQQHTAASCVISAQQLERFHQEASPSTLANL
ncbi:hypothetical protein E2C01_050046 [Portunus trituberculatus]|uniref:Uncharacterized protein n=1 Tax=Portunus trituberculatus TaxID=210409 RepID=A0A5B7GHU8_PORTR|nr:hypothetical protein [Portunus trituberculatus]